MKHPAPQTDWESHVLPDEATELASLWREADEIRFRLEAINVLTQEIERRATGRAKFANRVRRPDRSGVPV